MAELAEEFFKFNPWWENAFHPEFIPRPKYTGLYDKESSK